MLQEWSAYRLYHDQPEAPTKSARKTDSSGDYFDHFNSAIKIDTGKSIEVYHKSKLVPGIEMQFVEWSGKAYQQDTPLSGRNKMGLWHAGGEDLL